jgi:hypothetical protein
MDFGIHCLEPTATTTFNEILSSVNPKVSISKEESWPSIFQKLLVRDSGAGVHGVWLGLQVLAEILLGA